MKISPMDIQRHTFEVRFRGFDREEVRTFLNLLAEEIAALQRENEDQRRQNQNLEAHLAEHREREATLRNTLLTAQRVSEEIKENARKEAEVVLKQAEIQGDRLLELAQSRAHEVERSILDLHNQREVLRSDVRALIAQLTKILDLQEESDHDQALHFLKRRGSSA